MFEKMSVGDQDNHLKNLTRLCRTCGEFLSSEQRNNFPVKNEKIKQKILQHLLIKTEEDNPVIHPRKICFKCYSQLKNAEHRNTTFKHRTPCWTGHKVDCFACDKVKSLKKGGRPKKIKKQTGRYHGTNLFWTKDLSQNLKEKFTENFKKMNKLFYTGESLHLCLCKLCDQIIHYPTLITSCQHSLCYGCLIPKVEGVLLKDIQCPVCNVHFRPDDAKPSKIAIQMIMTLKPKPDGQKAPTFLNDVYNISSDGDIPEEFEEAALHIIKAKMEKSNLPNNSIEFKTGGSRVSLLCKISYNYLY